MMVDMKMIEMISEHAIHSFLLGSELSLSKKYEHFQYFVENKFKNY